MESYSAFLLVVCYSLIIWLCPSSSDLEIGNLIHFFTLLYTDEGQLVLSPLYLTWKVGNTLPCWTPADSYAYSDAEGSATSFCSKDSRPDWKPSFTIHLVEMDLVNLEIRFWYRVNLFFLLLRMLVFLHSPMPKDWDTYWYLAGRKSTKGSGFYISSNKNYYNYIELCPLWLSYPCIENFIDWTYL